MICMHLGKDQFELSWMLNFQSANRVIYIHLQCGLICKNVWILKYVEKLKYIQIQVS